MSMLQACSRQPEGRQHDHACSDDLKDLNFFPIVQEQHMSLIHHQPMKMIIYDILLPSQDAV
jgi:hypothetical protein